MVIASFIIRSFSLYVIKSSVKVYCIISQRPLIMSQRSITSFFSKVNGTTSSLEPKKESIVEEKVNTKTPKRQRSTSSGKNNSPKSKVEKLDKDKRLKKIKKEDTKNDTKSEKVIAKDDSPASESKDIKNIADTAETKESQTPKRQRSASSDNNSPKSKVEKLEKDDKLKSTKQNDTKDDSNKVKDAIVKEDSTAPESKDKENIADTAETKESQTPKRQRSTSSDNNSPKSKVEKLEKVNKLKSTKQNDTKDESNKVKDAIVKDDSTPESKDKENITDTAKNTEKEFPTKILRSTNAAKNSPNSKGDKVIKSPLVNSKTKITKKEHTLHDNDTKTEDNLLAPESKNIDDVTDIAENPDNVLLTPKQPSDKNSPKPHKEIKSPKAKPKTKITEIKNDTNEEELTLVKGNSLTIPVSKNKENVADMAKTTEKVIQTRKQLRSNSGEKISPKPLEKPKKSPKGKPKSKQAKKEDMKNDIKSEKVVNIKLSTAVDEDVKAKPSIEEDESSIDPNFKLAFSDDDSPLKAKKNLKKTRVSSSSSDDAEAGLKSHSPNKVKLEEPSPKPTQVHSFFTKKTLNSPKNETNDEKKANCEQTEDDSKQTPNSKPVQKIWLTNSSGNSSKVVGVDYKPSKPKYHPENDAFWPKGEPVPYLALARTLEEIENTSARLKIIDVLSNFFRSVIVLKPEDLVPAVYLCLNKLAPAYESVELGVAETYLMKAIAQATGRKLAQVKTLVESAGDLGLAAERARGAQMIMRQPPHLTIQSVLKGLKEIAKMTGQASMTKKINKIQIMFVACRHSEARYFIRSLAGKLRIGLAEQSVLQALAQAVTLTPPNKGILDASKGVPADVFKASVDQNSLIIKTTYCELPNYDIVISTLLEHGVASLPEKCKLTPGVPLKPMLAHPTKGVHEIFQRFEGCQFTCEWKYDGERAQIHVPANGDSADLKQAKIFSRNQEDNTTKYPDVLSRLGSFLSDSVVSCVLDCEAVAWDHANEKILPFQILTTRKRKDANVSDIKVHVCLFVFDLLYLNGRSLVTEPLQVRRQLLHTHFKEAKGEWHYASSRDCSTTDEVQEFLEESIKGSCEGLMVKTLSGKDSTYQIAKRSKNWLKLKKDYLDGVGDTIDAVVIGGYKGRGKRAGVYGGFLLACYDPDTEEYQSLCKIGTGFSDDDLQKHADTLKQHIADGPRTYYRYDSSHSPDEWFTPNVVWEIRCADLSISPVHCAAKGHIQPDKGISLRFPRFVRIRDDKTPEEATSSSQIARIYSSQDQVKNNATAPKEDDDDFY